MIDPTIETLFEHTGITSDELHKAQISFECVKVARKCYPLLEDKDFYRILEDGFYYSLTTCKEWLKMCRIVHDLIDEANRFVPLLQQYGEGVK